MALLTSCFIKDRPLHGFILINIVDIHPIINGIYKWLADRVRVHKQQIRDPAVRNTPCSAHFDICGHKQFIIFPFYKVKSDNENLRRAKENFFINIFKPKLNK